jgi:hypothetical protein
VGFELGRSAFLISLYYRRHLPLLVCQERVRVLIVPFLTNIETLPRRCPIETSVSFDVNRKQGAGWQPYPHEREWTGQQRPTWAAGTSEAALLHQTMDATTATHEAADEVRFAPSDDLQVTTCSNALGRFVRHVLKAVSQVPIELALRGALNGVEDWSTSSSRRGFICEAGVTDVESEPVCAQLRTMGPLPTNKHLTVGFASTFSSSHSRLTVGNQTSQMMRCPCSASSASLAARAGPPP